MTDACIDWATTEKLLLTLDERAQATYHRLGIAFRVIAA